MWKALTFLAIIFAGGISGTWLGEQMRAPLPWQWGWFGAILAGVAIFGGVNLATRGDALGWLIITATGLATVVMDIMYFWDDHQWLALPLGLFPTALAVLGGMVEARSTAHAETQQRAASEADRARQQRIQDEDRAHQRHLEELQLKATLRAQLIAAQAAAPSASPAPPAAPQRAASDTRSARQRVFDALDNADGDISNAALAETCGISEATARGYRAQWVQARGIARPDSAPAISTNPTYDRAGGNGTH